MRLLFLLALAGCDFSAATQVLDSGPGRSGDTGAPGEGAAGGSDGADGGAGDGSDGAGDGATDPAETDDDGDGYAEVDGDCDDTDPDVAPGLEDGCDGVDTDCDGARDEDAWREDPYEPNDDTPWVGGSLEDDPVHVLEGILHDDADVDRYRFSFLDRSWSLFDLTVGLSGIPDGAVYGLSVENTTTGVRHVFEEGGDSIEAIVSDTAFEEDGGDWEITVWSVSGATCAEDYRLRVVFSG